MANNQKIKISYKTGTSTKRKAILNKGRTRKLVR